MRGVVIGLALVVGVVGPAAAHHRFDKNSADGRWHAVTTVMAGKRQTGVTSKTVYLELHHGNYKVYNQGKLVDEGTFAIDMSSHPRKVDIFPKMNLQGPKQLKGLIMLHGKTLVECVAMPGQPRPTRFASSPKDKNILIEYEPAND
jgi:uncharacterized protein (TIGR03067 family)